MAVAYAYLSLRNKKVGIALAAVALMAMVAMGPSRIGTITAEEGAARGRLMAWGFGNRMLKQWPIFGAGQGRFAEFSDDGRAAHNSFLACWAELGLFGYFFWLGLAMRTMDDARALIRAASEEPEAGELKGLAAAGPAEVSGLFAASVFLSRTYHLPLYLLFALVEAMRQLYERDFGELQSAFVSRDCRYVLAAEFVSIPALYVLIRFLG